MEAWQHRYKDKIITAEQAAQMVKSGDVVRFPIGKAPIPILEALAKRNGELENVTIVQCYPVYEHPIWNDPEFQGSFRCVVDYVGAGCRRGMQSRLVDFLPLDYPQYPKQLEDGRTNMLASDIFFAVVSPPDRHGFVSFGNTLWYSKELVQNARVVVAEVDPTLIRTGGEENRGGGGRRRGCHMHWCRWRPSTGRT